MAQRGFWPAGPSHKVLLALVAGVLLLHALLFLGVTSPLEVRLNATHAPQPVQARVVLPAAPPPVARPPLRPAVKKTAPVQVDPASARVQTPSTDMASAPETAKAEASAPLAEVAQLPQSPTEVPPQPLAPASAAPTPLATAASTALPLISLGALPPSRLLSYQLSGMDKGLTYHASGELRWQHNDTAYELALSVRAFLLGSRHWRSVGQIDATGLAPRRFSDSWRNERAAHFDREQQRIVFSSNSTPAPLQAGAQDQVSLYVQLAAAMAGEPERFVPGTRLQVQTATVRDAQPWSLVLEGAEALAVSGQSVPVLKWVCQPRHQYDTRVEFWVSAQQAWLPLRIRITQASGSYIDLLWRGSEPLPPLPASGDTAGAPRGS